VVVQGEAENISSIARSITMEVMKLRSYITEDRKSSMFGFTGSESRRIKKRKRGYLVEALARGPFLTFFNASTITNERQLVTIAKDRRSAFQADAESDVGQ
jgi:hypothetical protein